MAAHSDDGDCLQFMDHEVCDLEPLAKSDAAQLFPILQGRPVPAPGIGGDLRHSSFLSFGIYLLMLYLRAQDLGSVALSVDPDDAI